MTEDLKNIGNDAFIDALQNAVAEILHSNIEGVSEYDLMVALETYPDIASRLERKNGDSLVLFRVHFLLRHVLYRLMDEWLEAQTACLEITPLLIKVHPYTAGNTSIASIDKVREYYLDLNNLIETVADDVDDLLASFWIGMNRYEHRDEALEALGLTDPVDDKVIRKTYRSLAMQHHPDRGGDKEIIQKLNDAAHLLLKTK